MLYYLPQLSDVELNDLFLAETTRFVEGMENNLTHNELASIRLTIKYIIEEIEKRKLKAKRAL